MDRGGRIRANHLWRALSAFGEVTPIVVGDRSQPRFRGELRRAGAAFFPRRAYDIRKLENPLKPGAALKAPPGLFEFNALEPMRPDLLDLIDDPFALNRHHLNEVRVQRICSRIRNLAPDVVVLCDTTMGIFVPYLRHLPTKIVLGPHNHDSHLYRSMSKAAPRDDLRRYYELMADAFEVIERTTIGAVDQLWVCSNQDAERFESHLPRKQIKVVPNVYDDDGPFPPADSRNLVSIGQQQYFPNAVAAQHLIEISRQLDGMGVRHTMQIVGRSVNTITEAARQAPNVVVTGDVPDVMPFLAGAAIVPVALTLGGGTRLKVVEAMSVGRPVISTPIGIEGIDATDGINAIIEPDLAKFPARIAELLDNPQRALEIGLAGHRLLKERYSHSVLLGCLEDALASLVPKAPPVRSESVFTSNLGLESGREIAEYDRFTRFLSWAFWIRLAATKTNLEVALVGPDDQPFPNGFATVGREEGGWIRIETEAILPEKVEPNAVRLRLWAWGREIGHFQPPTNLSDREAGFISAEPDGPGLRVTVWYGRGSARITTGAGGNIVMPGNKKKPELIGVGSATLPAKPDAAEVVILPEQGSAQQIRLPIPWRVREPQTTYRLNSWKDKYRGETAWLVGNGPSVRIEDLNQLAGKLTFCFNRFYLAHATTKLRSTFTVTADKQMIQDFGQEMVDQSSGIVFVADEKLPDILGNYIWLRLLTTSLFSMNPAQIVNPGGSSLFVAMQIAHFMGIRRLFIYGADFKFNFSSSRVAKDKFRSAVGEGNHFIPNYRAGMAWCPPSLKDIAPSFQLARHLFASGGGFIKNATRGGILEIFERTTFEAAVKES